MIRKATESDISLLVRWMNSLVDHVQIATNDVYITNIEKTDHNDLAAIFSTAIMDTDSQILINDDGNCSGFIYGRISQPFLPVSTIKRVGLIEMCWVDESCRKQGIARMLTKEIEFWFSKKEVEYVELNFLVGNSEAELSWEQLGYKPFRVAARKKL
jgi:GNAT superfamily N-acetyltransferase